MSTKPMTPRQTKVEQDYEDGKWVPSYYGNKFTVAQRQFVGSESEQSLTFRVATLAEAQAEADQRNQIAIMKAKGK